MRHIILAALLVAAPFASADWGNNNPPANPTAGTVEIYTIGCSVALNSLPAGATRAPWSTQLADASATGVPGTDLAVDTRICYVGMTPEGKSPYHATPSYQYNSFMARVSLNVQWWVPYQEYLGMGNYGMGICSITFRTRRHSDVYGSFSPCMHYQYPPNAWQANYDYDLIEFSDDVQSGQWNNGGALYSFYPESDVWGSPEYGTISLNSQTAYTVTGVGRWYRATVTVDLPGSMTAWVRGLTHLNFGPEYASRVLDTYSAHVKVMSVNGG